jgi:WD40-like Beta Propeller Repeat
MVVYEPRRDNMTRLTFSGAPLKPTWSPDGRYILYTGIRYVLSDGAGKPQLLFQGNASMDPFSFTPDGKRLAYHSISGHMLHYNIWTTSIESDPAGLRPGKPESFRQAPADEFAPLSLPMAAGWPIFPTSRGSMRFYVRAFPDKGGEWQISNAEAATRSGRATGANCSSETRTTGLWWPRTPQRRIRLSRISRTCGQTSSSRTRRRSATTTLTWRRMANGSPR